MIQYVSIIWGRRYAIDLCLWESRVHSRHPPNFWGIAGF